MQAEAGVGEAESAGLLGCGQGLGSGRAAEGSSCRALGRERHDQKDGPDYRLEKEGEGDGGRGEREEQRGDCSGSGEVIKAPPGWWQQRWQESKSCQMVPCGS